MKILIIYEKYLPEIYGGVATYIRDFSQTLVSKGHVVDIACSTNRKDLEGTQKWGDVTINRIYFNRGGPASLRFTNRRRFMSFVRKLYKQGNYKILNLHNPGFGNLTKLKSMGTGRILSTIHAVSASETKYKTMKRLKFYYDILRTAYDVAKFPVKYPVLKKLGREQLQGSDHILVMSKYVANMVKKYYPSLDNAKISILPVGVDFEKFTPPNSEAHKLQLRKKFDIDPDGIVIFTLRKLEPSRYGVGNLIKAVIQIKDLIRRKKVKLLIGGDGSLKKGYEGMVRKAGLSESIRFLGYVEHVDASDYYRVADAFVVPTEELEGFGIVTLEALASNLPVIATPAGATPEILSDFNPELIASDVSSASIANILTKFIKNTHAYKQLNHRERAKSKFSWGPIIDRFMNLCNES